MIAERIEGRDCGVGRNVDGRKKAIIRSEAGRHLRARTAGAANSSAARAQPSRAGGSFSWEGLPCDARVAARLVKRSLFPAGCPARGAEWSVPIWCRGNQPACGGRRRMQRSGRVVVGRAVAV